MTGAAKYAPNARWTCAEVAQRCSRGWDVPVDTDRIIITTGAIGGLFSALFAVLDAGDEAQIRHPGLPELRKHRGPRRRQTCSLPVACRARFSRQAGADGIVAGLHHRQLEDGRGVRQAAGGNALAGRIAQSRRPVMQPARTRMSAGVAAER